MNVRRRVVIVLAGACAFGVVAGLVKGDETGLRAGLGNLSAPWVLLPLFAGMGRRRSSRGSLAGLATTFTALAGFYAALTFGALGGHLGGGGHAAELVRELRANRIYFVFGAVTAPLAGAIGARLGEGRARTAWLIAGATAALELVVVALVRDRQLLPAPLYFSWTVQSWTPYVIEATIGVVVVASVAAQMLLTGGGTTAPDGNAG